MNPRQLCLRFTKRAVMVIGVVLLAIALTDAQARACEAPQSTREILAQLRVPEDLRKAAAEHKAQKLELLRTALRSAPEDLFLHEAYQDLQIGRIGDQRETVIEEYEQLLARNPRNPVFLYLAARAQYGRKTRQAIENLQAVLISAPEFAMAHLLLAEIYSAPAFADPVKVAHYLDRFSESCPSSVRVFPALRWSKDRELISRTAARVRKALAGRTDAEAEATYSLLWNLEAALERSDNQATNRERVSKDAQFLQDKQFARNKEWLAALEFAADLTARPELARDARSELASLFPNSLVAIQVASSGESNGNPHARDNPTAEQTQAYRKRRREIELALAHKWPDALGIVGAAFLAVVHDESATPKEVGEAVDLFKHAVKQDPEGWPSSPPLAIDAAEQLIERGVRIEDVPALVREGFTLTERVYSVEAKSDLYVRSAESSKVRRDSWYLYGYFPLAEAFIRLGQMPSAKDTLRQIEDKINNTRPPDNASAGQKFSRAEMEARFWYLKGLYAEAEGRKLDALISYRNSIATFPVRSPRPDRRDEVMQAAQRLWKQLGGTAQAWNDWAAHSSVRNFYAGTGEGSAWSHLMGARPNLVLTDSLGNQWKPAELSKKVTFLTLWASWCGPCRAELPYVEKLYGHFKGRQDVVILALDVDDDPKVMDTTLRELQVALPSIAARDFVYALVPAMALPANWIITPSKTEMFNDSSDTLEQWLENATKACERAAGSTDESRSRK